MQDDTLAGNNAPSVCRYIRYEWSYTPAVQLISARFAHSLNGPNRVLFGTSI